MFLNRNCFAEQERRQVDFLNEHYEYCYLESMHYLNSIKDTTTIITGLSYGLDGLETNLLSERAVNFAMHSQDLYYDNKHIKRAIANSQGKISQCIITLGYYSLFYDLSLSSSKKKCVQTYLPLFSDVHHVELGMAQNYEFAYHDENKHFCRQFFREYPQFYGRAILREQTSPSVMEKGGWLNMSASEREYEAYQLAEKHNRHIVHTQTHLENMGIMDDMLGFLEERHVRPIVTILPFSKEYLKYIDPSYKEAIIECLEKSPFNVEFIDMNEEPIWDESDMLDSDHLNEKGAAKATLLVDGLIHNLF